MIDPCHELSWPRAQSSCPRKVPKSTQETSTNCRMATRRSRWSLRDDNRMVVASRRRGGHGRDGRRFAATKRLRSSLRDDNIDDEVVMSWRSPLRGDETVAVVASRRDDDMMVVASRRRGGHGGDGRRFAATRWSQLYFLPCFHTSTVWTNEDGMLTPMSLFSGTRTEMVKRRSRVLRRRTRQAALDKPRVHDGQLGFAILEQKAAETAENRAFEEKQPSVSREFMGSWWSEDLSD